MDSATFFPKKHMADDTSQVEGSSILKGPFAAACAPFENTPMSQSEAYNSNITASDQKRLPLRGIKIQSCDHTNIDANQQKGLKVSTDWSGSKPSPPDVVKPSVKPGYTLLGEPTFKRYNIVPPLKTRGSLSYRIKLVSGLIEDNQSISFLYKNKLLNYAPYCVNELTGNCYCQAFDPTSI